MNYNILLIGSNKLFTASLSEQLSNNGIASVYCENFDAANQALKTEYKSTDLLVISFDDEPACYHTVLSLQTKHLYKDIPFLVVGEKSVVLRGLALGAKDYFVIAENNSLDDNISALSKSLFDALENMRSQKLQKNTNIVIEMSFKEYFLSEIKRAERGCYDLSMLFFSLVPRSDAGIDDPFKIFSYIKRLRTAVHSKLRTTDTLIQYDSHNIIAFLPFTSPQNAEAVSAKINKIVEDSFMEEEDKDAYSLVYSIVSYPEDGSEFEDLLFNAENVLHSSISNI